MGYTEAEIITPKRTATIFLGEFDGIGYYRIISVTELRERGVGVRNLSDDRI